MTKPLERLNGTLNALKHGVTSRQDLLPWEDPQELEGLFTEWRAELKPSCKLLEEALNAIVMNRWYRMRNARALALHVACDPFGREVARHGGPWVEVARKLINERDAHLSKLSEFAEAARKELANAPEKRLLKAAERIAKQTQGIANQFRISAEFFLGIGEAMSKQADRAMELDAQFQKHLAAYFNLEQYVATRQRLLPQEKKKSSPALDVDELSSLPSKNPIDEDENWGDNPEK